ncbi:MAG: ATP-binding protein [Spirochaetales bacterium]
MKPPAGPAPLPTFRDTLVRVGLLPALLFLAGILVSAVLIVWRTNSTFEGLNLQLSQATSRQVQDRWDRQIRQLQQVAFMADQLGVTQTDEALIGEFSALYWVDDTGKVLDSWPERSTVLPPAVATLLSRLGNRTEVWDTLSVGTGPRPALAVVHGRVRVAGIVDPSPLQRDIETLASRVSMKWVLVDTQGLSWLGSLPPHYTAESARHSEGSWWYSDQVDGVASQVFVWRLGERSWSLLLTRNQSGIDSPVLAVYIVVISIAVLMVVLVLVFLGGLNRQLFRALESLKSETRRITLGDYSEKLTRTPYQDLNDILQDFESMRESVWLRQQDLKDSEHRFRRMFEEAAVGILHTTFAGVPIDLNLAMARMLEYASPNEALQHITDIGTDLYVRPEERQAILQMLTETAQGRLQITTEFYTRSRRTLTVTNHLGRVYDTHRGEFILEAFVEDITEIKAAERAVLELNAVLERKVADRTRHLELTLENLKTAQDQLIRSEKMAALGQLIAGIAHEINTPLGAISASNDNIASLLKRVLEALPFLLGLLNPEQKSLFYRMYEEAYRGVEVIPSAQLRHKRKEAQSLLSGPGLEVDDELIDCLAELDLTGRVGEFRELILDPLGKDAVKMVYEMISLEKSCLIIERASDKAAKVIGALRTLSHEERSGTFHQVDLRENLENVLTLFQSRLKHGVELRKNLGECLIWGYADRLAQVWTNLVSNALQAMDYKGLLEIEAVPVDEEIRVSVRDSGPGISDAVMARIFEPFFTTKPAGEGSGLGLDICRKIVEEHRGRIEVTSVPGKTEFAVFLPRNPPDQV